MNIVVRAPNWIGDQVLAFPFFYYLRKSFPNARITSVCVEWVQDLQYTTLVDEVFVLPAASKNNLFHRFKSVTEGADLLKEKVKEKAKENGPWDLGISLPNSLSAAWFLHRAGVRTRRGYAVDGRSLLLNDRVKWNADPARHRAQAYVDLLPEGAQRSSEVRSFWGIPPESDLDIETPGVLKTFNAKEEWKDADPIEPPEEAFWVMAPGATAVSRRWFDGSFVQLARKIHQETGLKGVVVGGVKEVPLVSRICEDSDLGLLDFSGSGSVSDLWKIFQGAQFTVTNESGLAHVAALCGSPVQIICGAADPRRTRPLGPGKVQVKMNPVECWPCERNSCFQREEKYLQCLRGIRTEDVFEELKTGFGI